MRVFQKRMLSGSPSRSRGPGSSSRKKSASWASKERSPFGTILTGDEVVAGGGGGVGGGGGGGGGKTPLSPPPPPPPPPRHDFALLGQEVPQVFRHVVRRGVPL